MVVVVDVETITGPAQGTRIGEQALPGCDGGTQKQSVGLLHELFDHAHALWLGSHQNSHQPVHVSGGGGGGVDGGMHGV